VVEGVGVDMVKVREMNELKGHERSVCVTMAHGGTKRCTMHDTPTVRLFRANEFAQSSLIQSCRRRLIHLGKSWRPLADTEPGRQAIHKDFVNGVIKATHSLRSHKFLL
jgi:hypothetical protein